MYKKLCKPSSIFKGIPEIYWHGNYKDNFVLVMEYLGLSLEKLFYLCNKKFSLKTVLLIAIQLITLIENTHKRGILHRDIKPDNFVIGQSLKNKTIYMIDFGLSKNYIYKKKHKPFRDDKSLTGTLRYPSIRNHLGIEQSRRDDLESLGYMLLFFLKGSLPWQGICDKEDTRDERHKKIRLVKIHTSPKKLCQGLPSEFYEYMCYCKTLEYKEKPNYEYLINLFKNLYISKNYDNSKNIEYDWYSILTDPNKIKKYTDEPIKKSKTKTNKKIYKKKKKI